MNYCCLNDGKYYLQLKFISLAHMEDGQVEMRAGWDGEDSLCSWQLLTTKACSFQSIQIHVPERSDSSWGCALGANAEFSALFLQKAAGWVTPERICNRGLEARSQHFRGPGSG